MNISLEGKNAIVCGGSRGIGKASAIELALLGANVTLIARDENSLILALPALDISKDQKHDYCVADFSDTEKLKSTISELTKNKTYHILVNNSGGPAAGEITKATEDSFIKTFQQHLIGNHIMALAVIPGMQQSRYGRIINIISTSVKVPLKGLGVSNTIRGAVANWSKTMANELASFGITVNNVLPGATATERLQEIINNKSGKLEIDKDEVENDMKNEIPMKRFGEPSEIAAAVAFLATPAAAYITGINVPVDGGRTGSL